MVFTPKAGKKDAAEPRSDRSISLTSFFLKKIEQILDKYIQIGTVEKISLHLVQYAYPTGKSTSNAPFDNTFHHSIESMTRAK